MRRGINPHFSSPRCGEVGRGGASGRWGRTERGRPCRLWRPLRLAASRQATSPWNGEERMGSAGSRFSSPPCGEVGRGGASGRWGPSVARMGHKRRRPMPPAAAPPSCRFAPSHLPMEWGGKDGGAGSRFSSPPCGEVGRGTTHAACGVTPPSRPSGAPPPHGMGRKACSRDKRAGMTDEGLLASATRQKTPVG